MYIMQISKHSPESCPGFNQNVKKQIVALMQQMDSLLAKHKVKLAGMWTDHAGHETYVIYEAPSMDTVLPLFNEPAMMARLAHDTVNIKVVVGPEETKALVMRD